MFQHLRSVARALLAAALVSLPTAAKAQSVVLRSAGSARGYDGATYFQFAVVGAGLDTQAIGGRRTLDLRVDGRPTQAILGLLGGPCPAGVAGFSLRWDGTSPSPRTVQVICDASFGNMASNVVTPTLRFEVATGFRPSTNGFRFANFGEHLADIPLGAHCFGMAQASVDYFVLGRPVPRLRETPPPGSSLRDFLNRRQTGEAQAAWARFVVPKELGFRLASTPDERARVLAPTIGRIKAGMLRGQPVVLMVVGGWGGRAAAGHALVAFALTELEDRFWIHVYDPNLPGEDRAKLTVWTTDREARRPWDVTYSHGEFDFVAVVEDYVPREPPRD